VSEEKLWTKTIAQDLFLTKDRCGFKAESLLGHITRKASSPLPSLLSFSSLPCHPSPLPSLRSRPPQIQLEGLGERCKLPPAVSGAEPQPKSNLVHFSLKIWRLVATILMIFLRINWTNFMQLGKLAPNWFYLVKANMHQIRFRLGSIQVAVRTLQLQAKI